VKEKQGFGSGALFVVANNVYGLLVCTFLLVVTNVLLLLTPLLISAVQTTALQSTALQSTTAAGPGVGPLAFGPWMVLVAWVPLGPSFVAAAHCCNRLIAGQDSGMAADYWRALARNAKEALAVWLPLLAVLAIIVFNLGNLQLAGSAIEPALRIALLVLALLVCTVAVNALLLVSRFSFRSRDLFRLAVYCVGAQKRVSLGNCAILFVAASLLVVTSAALSLFIAGALVYVICLNSQPLLQFIEQKFTVPAE
jgi:uncharacterized membrane protein YesL